MSKIIIVTAKRAGHRRCGIAHPSTAVEYPAKRFTAAELEILKADPALVVHEQDDGKGDKPMKDK